MTVCRLCRERTAVRTFVLTMPGRPGGTVTHLCKPCARALIPEKDWSTFGLEEGTVRILAGEEGA